MPIPPAVVHFRCPACRFGLRAAVPMAGRSTTCPECGDPLTVPPASTRAPDTELVAVETLTIAQLRAALNS